ncbi:unnamed protein product [Clonostachys rhizophaga]|uniref:Uncharacterized protein n=1 Tax=Clonostachys rhizophaga TaxID=160324 RepID=A0A9N9V9L7_9HYPO|nr:unnamed protein product [Clonostachys rhizophaga]
MSKPSHLSGQDYASPLSFDLGKAKLNKTVDIGNNGVSASTDQFGRVLQLSTYHPIHGIIVAAPDSQFDKTRYHDPQYVRQYRTKMLQMLANDEEGFGIVVRDLNLTFRLQHLSMSAARSSCTTKRGICVTTTMHVDDERNFSQTVVLRNPTTAPMFVDYRINLRLSVHRASYGQLTEGGPLIPPDCENHLHLEDNTTFSVTNPLLGGCLLGSLTLDDKPHVLSGIQESVSTGVLSDAISPVQTITIDTESQVTLRAQFTLFASIPDKDPVVPSRTCSGENRRLCSGWRDASRCSTYIVRRNVDYILGNCVVPMPGDVVGLITDHVALPLGWNRDNYWQWRLLLNVYQRLGKLLEPIQQDVYKTRIERALKGHLKWAHEVAERPHTFWHRSYVIAGKPKDGPTFQLDQQCYPLLELCDYSDAFPDDKTFVRDLVRGMAVREVLSSIVSRRDASSGLFPTDETPGDDAVDHPFHFSSHVLLWYTVYRTAKLFLEYGAPMGFSHQGVLDLATSIRRATLEHFIQNTEGDEESEGFQMIAYLVDGLGTKTFYHDANDIPTIFAVQWGFLTSEAEIKAWHNTMAFALSPRNRLGYVAGGDFSGLGSVHSKGPWPLGYFQELLYAHMTGDDAGREGAIKRIVGSMQWDGTFGEAVNSETGAVTSKAWFSWPGAMIGSMIVEEGIYF